LTKFFLFIILLLPAYLFAASESEQERFAKIIKISRSGDKSFLRNEAVMYFKRFPKGSLVPDVKILLAENEESTFKAKTMYRDIIKIYPKYARCDYALFRICEIEYLRSDWKSLLDDSNEGLSYYKGSVFTADFIFFDALSLYNKRQYKEAQTLLQNIITDFPNYQRIDDVKIILSYLDGKGADSLKYQRSLYSSYISLKGQGYISTIYLLGRQYEFSQEFAKAASAYNDIIKNYPRSPEADLAKKRLSAIAPADTIKPVDYKPDMRNNEKPVLNLKPETDIVDTGKKSESFYSVEIGPLYNLQNAKDIRSEIKKEFEIAYIMKKEREFTIMVGRYGDSEEALTVKIRLAEEMGINGNIIFHKKDKGIEFIYGDGDGN
jgi:tetratricopeptide (TPR) repeat protein